MEGKDSVCKILKSIMGVEIAMSRDLLIDYIMGTPSQQIAQRGLENTEEYGCGDNKDEEHWNLDRRRDYFFYYGCDHARSDSFPGSKYRRT